jgi:hypothetical protein
MAVRVDQPCIHAPCGNRRGQAGWHYFLHYNGWNKKFDEWIEESGMVRASEAEAAGVSMLAASVCRVFCANRRLRS